MAREQTSPIYAVELSRTDWFRVIFGLTRSATAEGSTPREHADVEYLVRRITQQMADQKVMVPSGDGKVKP